jgi:hypothetical protein
MNQDKLFQCRDIIKRIFLGRVGEVVSAGLVSERAANAAQALQELLAAGSEQGERLRRFVIAVAEQHDCKAPPPNGADDWLDENPKLLDEHIHSGLSGCWHCEARAILQGKG